MNMTTHCVDFGQNSWTFEHLCSNFRCQKPLNVAGSLDEYQTSCGVDIRKNNPTGFGRDICINNPIPTDILP